MYSLIVTAKMNDIDPKAWLADVLARLPDIPVSRLPSGTRCFVDRAGKKQRCAAVTGYSSKYP
jgi:transposase